MQLHHVFPTCFALLLAAGPAAVAEVVVMDTFADGSPADTPADAADVDWYRATGNLAGLSVSGSGAMDSGLRVDNFGGQKYVVGVLDQPVTLGADAGDQLRLSLDRLAFGSSAAEMFSKGIVFGLASSNGTPTSGDEDGTVGNDVGYAVQHATYTSGTSTLEQFDVGYPFGSTQQIATSSAALNLNTFAHQTLMLVLTRQANGSVAFDYYAQVNTTPGEHDPANLALLLSGIDQTPLDSFDQIVVGSWGGGTDFRIDNVRLETIPVPEPASLVWIGAAMVGVMGRRVR